MKSTTVLVVLATIIFTILYRTMENRVLLSLAITAGTISYHFVMRYAVAGIFSHAMHNRANLSRKWYQQKKWEKKLYQKLHVKQWKNKMPTYEPSYFDLRLHTPEEIAGAMCQAEVSHEVIVIFSFLPSEIPGNIYNILNNGGSEPHHHPYISVQNSDLPASDVRKLQNRSCHLRLPDLPAPEN